MHESKDLLESLLADPSSALIDVRSEKEFERSGIPGFASLPLLYQNERSQVGLCYKMQGQAAAIELGHRLVDPHRSERVKAWAACILASPAQKARIICWRGGLRSKIATQWIREAGFTAEQVPGGYKKLRQTFLDRLQQPPPLVILAGPTGAGKTELLLEFQDHALDIEAAARHRGSAFGGTKEPQPTQTWFENTMALRLFRPEVLVEDESRMLGQLCIPEAFYQTMIKAPLIHLEVPLEERLRRIFAEYVAAPLAEGLAREDLQRQLLRSLDNLKRRLDRDHAPIRDALIQAFAQDPSWENHAPWIEALLLRYYDRLYHHAAQRIPRTALFKGDREACRMWLKERFRPHA